MNGSKERYHSLYLQPLINFDGRPQQTDVVHILAANLTVPAGMPCVHRWRLPAPPQARYLQCRSDPNVFTKSEKEGKIMMALTIDDFLVAASSPAVYRNLLRVISPKYKIKDLGPATRILNWTLRRSPTNRYHLSQPHKTQQFIDIMGMSQSHPTKTPQTPGHLFHARRADERPQPYQYPFAAAL